MQLNGIDLIGYNADGNVVSFLLDCDFSGAEALDGQELRVTGDAGDIEVFGGYQLLGVRHDGDRVLATFMQALEPNTAQAISALQRNMTIANDAIAGAVGDAASAQQAADEAGEAAATATDLAEVNAAAIEEIAATVFAE